MEANSFIAAINHSRAMLVVHATAFGFELIVMLLIALGIWALARSNWRGGILLGGCAFLWSQLLLPYTAVLSASVAAAKLHLLGLQVSEHWGLIAGIAKHSAMSQRLALLGVPAGLLVAVVGYLRAQSLGDGERTAAL